MERRDSASSYDTEFDEQVRRRTKRAIGTNGTNGTNGTSASKANHQQRKRQKTIASAACAEILKGDIGTMVAALLANETSHFELLVELLSKRAFVKEPVHFLSIMKPGAAGSQQGNLLLDFGLRFVRTERDIGKETVRALSSILTEDEAACREVARAAASSTTKAAAAIFESIALALSALSAPAAQAAEVPIIPEYIIVCAYDAMPLPTALKSVLRINKKQVAHFVVSKFLESSASTDGSDGSVELLISEAPTAVFGSSVMDLIKQALATEGAKRDRSLALVAMLAEKRPIETARRGLFSWAVEHDLEALRIICKHELLRHGLADTPNPVQVAVKAVKNGNIDALVILGDDPCYKESMIPLDGKPCAHMLVERGVSLDDLLWCVPEHRLHERCDAGMTLAMTAAHAAAGAGAATSLLLGLLERGLVDHTATTETGACLAHYVAQLPYSDIEAIATLCSKLEETDRQTLLASMHHIDDRMRIPLEVAMERDVYVEDCLAPRASGSTGPFGSGCLGPCGASGPSGPSGPSGLRSGAMVKMHDPSVPAMLRLIAALDTDKSLEPRATMAKALYCVVRNYGDVATEMLDLAVELGYSPSAVAKAACDETIALLAAKKGRVRVLSKIAELAGTEIVDIMTSDGPLSSGPSGPSGPSGRLCPLYFLVLGAQIPCSLLVSIHTAMLAVAGPRAASVVELARKIGLLSESCSSDVSTHTIEALKSVKASAELDAARASRVTKLRDYFGPLATRISVDHTVDRVVPEDLKKLEYIASLNEGSLEPLLRSDLVSAAVLASPKITAAVLSECSDVLVGYLLRLSVDAYLDGGADLDRVPHVARYTDVAKDVAERNWTSVLCGLYRFGLQSVNLGSPSSGLRFRDESGIGDGVTREICWQMYQKAVGAAGAYGATGLASSASSGSAASSGTDGADGTDGPVDGKSFFAAHSGLVPMPGADPRDLEIVGFLLASSYRCEFSIGSPQLSPVIVALMLGIMGPDFFLEMHGGMGFCTGKDLIGGSATLDTETALVEYIGPFFANAPPSVVASVVEGVGTELNSANFKRFLELAAQACTHWDVLGKPISHLRDGFSAGLTGDASGTVAEFVLAQFARALGPLVSRANGPIGPDGPDGPTGPVSAISRGYERISEIILGTVDIDFAAVRNNTKYERYTDTDPTMRMFWEILESFNDEDRRQMYQFWTASRAAPLGFASEHRIGMLPNRAPRASGANGAVGASGSSATGMQRSKRLLRAATCFKQILVPHFEPSERAQLEECIRTSMANCGVIEDGQVWH